ncbi:peptidoglycan-recognition protein SB2-like [Macrosteles quadrilineatus]|uniref:peptidoglycan-recognition protein SB2-like n=1 Tax=Macrosteles quadrilineatus TaxID=74068 RepID=UPI0023E13794|nr:peptidoglycan-recognition protein SB2-like [Macrosteles quadrilineatus]
MMDKDPTIITRDEWQAPPILQNMLIARLPVIYVFCMSTHTRACSNPEECHDLVHRLEKIHTEIHHHIAIRYNFVITGEGSIYEGRGWGVQAMLPLRYTRYNDRSLVVGFMGDYLENTLPRLMKRRREELVQYGIKNKYISENFEAIQIFKQNGNKQEIVDFEV